jgi:16S rRNA (uracil1498-N3)-methyltransferase
MYQPPNASRLDHDRARASATLMKALRPRFVVATAFDASGVVHVEGAELHHMRDVLRLAVGRGVSILDKDGGEHFGTLMRYERDRATIQIESSRAPQIRPRIILATAIVKGPRMDFVVEKAAELGAAELWPIVAAHSIVRAPGTERLLRWRRLALAAAKQSHSQRPMDVLPPMNFADLIRAVPKDTLAVICAANSEPLGDAIRRLKPRTILIAVGPEGGFDASERDAAARAGFVAAGLGANRLRSETAALAAVSIAAETLHAAR